MALAGVGCAIRAPRQPPPKQRAEQFVFESVGGGAVLFYLFLWLPWGRRAEYFVLYDLKKPLMSLAKQLLEPVHELLPHALANALRINAEIGFALKVVVAFGIVPKL